MASFERLPARASGAGAHRRREAALRKRCRFAPLSPPHEQRKPPNRAALVWYGFVRAIAGPRQRRGRSSVCVIVAHRVSSHRVSSHRGSRDRTSVGEGKSVTVSVDLGVRRIIKKKKKKLK